jgi:hypothetical protein
VFVALLGALASCSDDDAPPTHPTPPASPSSASPSSSPSVSPSASVSPTRKPVALFDLRRAELTSGASFDVPRAKGCPAAKIAFQPNNGGRPQNVVDGVEYLLPEQGRAVSYGDVTGDGHDEAIVLITCRNTTTGSGGRVMIVLAASGPKTYESIAVGSVLDEKTQSLVVRNREIVAYLGNSALRSYRLAGSTVVPS